MAIPASHIVEVLPRVIAHGDTDLELNGLLLSENPDISAGTMVLSFTSAASVAAYFGADSTEAGAAAIYFNSYDNKQAAPRAFLAARRVTAAVPAWLRGGRLSISPADLQQVTDGDLVISVDNTAYTLSGLNLSGAGSFSEAALVIQTKLRAAGADNVTVDYAGRFGAIRFTSGTSGAASALSFASSPTSGPQSGQDLAALLRLREKDDAVLSCGMDALSVDAQMAAILAVTQNWVSFTTAWEPDLDEALAWAKWADAHYGWLYVAYSTAANLTSPDSSLDLASRLKAENRADTAVIYGSLEYAAFMMGVVASVAWQRVNSTISLAFKKQAGLAAYVVDEATASVLEAKNCNYMGRFASRNADFVFLYPGVLCNSDYGFIDPYINSIWLNNRLQAALLEGLTATGRVPYNDQGYTRIKSWMMAPVNQARSNGVIEKGVQLSEAQKTEVKAEAGLDIASELWTQGYYLQVQDPGAAERANRNSPIINIWYTYAGAIQKISVASTALL